ncbi:hypothetical protein Tcan_09048 [Toxocara canis]|uniref:Uncharacterized protein n=1 Tax=Toxocara canis TaxID=6265 RepID=A0A0B2VC02_TOXCA|nr:hypothetical protein Tcan_09048 [Toxocara canis]
MRLGEVDEKTFVDEEPQFTTTEQEHEYKRNTPYIPGGDEIMTNLNAVKVKVKEVVVVFSNFHCCVGRLMRLGEVDEKTFVDEEPQFTTTEQEHEYKRNTPYIPGGA